MANREYFARRQDVAKEQVKYFERCRKQMNKARKEKQRKEAEM